MNKKVMKTHSLIAFLATSIVACSGNSPSPNDNSLGGSTPPEMGSAIPDDLVEFVAIIEGTGNKLYGPGVWRESGSEFGYEQKMTAHFYQLTKPISASQLVDRSDIDKRGCHYYETPLDNPWTVITHPNDTEANLISAGEVLPLLSDTGSFAELSSDDPLLGYKAETIIGLDDQPLSIMINAPGEEFPAIVDYQIPAFNAIEGIGVYSRDGATEFLSLPYTFRSFRASHQYRVGSPDPKEAFRVIYLEDRISRGDGATITEHSALCRGDAVSPLIFSDSEIGIEGNTHNYQRISASKSSFDFEIRNNVLIMSSFTSFIGPYWP